MTKNDVSNWATNGGVLAAVLAVGRWATKRFNSVAMGSIRVVDARYDKVLAELAEAKVLIARLEESRLYATKEREAAREERKNLQDQIEDLREDRH